MAQFAQFALRTNLILVAVRVSETFGMYECETLFVPARRKVFISKVLFVRQTKRYQHDRFREQVTKEPNINTPVSPRRIGGYEAI